MGMEDGRDAVDWIGTCIVMFLFVIGPDSPEHKNMEKITEAESKPARDSLYNLSKLEQYNS